MRMEDLIEWLYILNPVEYALKQVYQKHGVPADAKTMVDLLFRNGGSHQSLRAEYLHYNSTMKELCSEKNSEMQSPMVGRELIEEYWFSEGEEISVRRHGRYMPPFRHQHRFIEAVYVFDGTGEQTVFLKSGDERIALKKGDLCILPPSIEHELVAMEDNSILINILIRPSTMRNRLNLLIDENHSLFQFFLYTLYENELPNYILIHTGEDARIHGLIMEMISETCDQRVYSQKALILMLGLLFTYVQRDYAENIGFSESLSSGINYIPQILLYIEKNYATTGVEEIAAHFSFSRSYLSRIFRQYTQKTVIDVLMAVRIGHACEALKNTTLTVSAIAEKVGYEDVSYFTRAFKKFTGMTPLEYRKST